MWATTSQGPDCYVRKETIYTHAKPAGGKENVPLDSIRSSPSFLKDSLELE